MTMTKQNAKQSSLTNLTALSLVVGLAAFGSSNAIAQSKTKKAAVPAPAPAAATAAPKSTALTPPAFGAAIPGQCFINQAAINQMSSMGQAAAKRMEQLGAQVKAELDTEGATLEKEFNEIKAAEKTTPPAQKATWEKRARDWTDKQQKFAAKAELRNRELQATGEQVSDAISARAIPHINSVVTSRACAYVVSVDALLAFGFTSEKDGKQQMSTFVYANPAMDITRDVVSKMDSSGEKLPTFDRIQARPQGQAAATK
jgi:Skp family chaperone for outer membrane proteins